MNTKLLSLAALAGLMVSSCMNDDVVMENTDPKGDAITFSASVGRASRATEIDLGTLGNFGVYARGVDRSTGLFYPTYILGDENNPEIAHRYEAKEGENTVGAQRWELDRNVYWPTGIDNVLFWGFTTLHKDTSAKNKAKGVFQGNGTLKFDNFTGPALDAFSPRRDSVHTAEKNVVKSYIDGSNQQDLLVSFTPVSNPSSSNVSLNFEHALSQIKIYAKAGEGLPTGLRLVKVKGAWIVNARSVGNLSAGYNYNQDVVNGFSCRHTWSNLSNPVAYGTIFDTPKELTEKPTSILSSSNVGSLMLIPQKLPAWTGKQPNVTYDNVGVVKDQAYILLYCRIETVHEGELTDKDDALKDSPISNDDVNSRHYHQLYPKSNVYDANAYGYTCVPINIDWVRGKTYTYTLNICGKNTGGGVYPPELPDDLPPFEPPTDKDPGDPILNDPISFSVTVTPWDEYKWQEGETGGDIPMQ